MNGGALRDYPLNSNTWGTPRSDAAYRCNGYVYSGFDLMDWFDVPVNGTIAVYFKDGGGNLTQLGHPITVTNVPGNNYGLVTG